MMQKYLSGEIDFKFDIRRSSNFHFIKLEEVVIYTFLACTPIGAGKLLFFKSLTTGTT